MFHRSATLDGYYAVARPPEVSLLTNSLLLLADINIPAQRREIKITISLMNSGGSPMTWSAQPTGAASASVKVSPASGELQPGGSVALEVTINTSNLDEGTHDLGAIQIDAGGNGSALPAVQVPVSVYVGAVEYQYLPITRR